PLAHPCVFTAACAWARAVPPRMLLSESLATPLATRWSLVRHQTVCSAWVWVMLFAGLSANFDSRFEQLGAGVHAPTASPIPSTGITPRASRAARVMMLRTLPPHR